MLTFEQALEVTRKYSAHPAYEDEELRLLFDCAMETPEGSAIVEIGAEYGRSTTLLLQVAKERQLNFTIVEVEPRPELIAALAAIGYKYFLAALPSADYHPSTPIGFLHIDGNHDYENVKGDLEDFATQCFGWIVCHDYERPTLENVKIAVDEFVKTLGPNVAIRTAGSAFAFKER